MQNTRLNHHSSMTKEERDLAVLKAQKVKELAFKLVVKIISWESGASESMVVKSSDKITPEEWLRYKKHRMNIPTTLDKKKVADNLTRTYNSIKANGGFA
ncbi:hypothetical protein A3B45_05155 [Candidatus Daviesbacteria bacterium RIFCSPLOWO2_01_FULL_39_12]|uniref:Uncharacterized protein n=1 Tax=Candidatus Daviesbacteria bacterium RIFCSPLOWO2_01_FULL_39_12 TaxID=1797785 RepID=A0A1F5KUA0_9BACT|nr:MAG: hypothetical protein A3B45_05155 [Candidatus Daviesbacteria bacterium RIFCSPLOWO2_01_FULL_39_12]